MVKDFIHPYIPNGIKQTKDEMLKRIGSKTIEDLYSCIPEHLRIEGRLDIPEAISSELELKQHVEAILNENITCAEYTNFLGAGCYDHYVPAICDEINSRSEFLTAYSGDTYSDLGKNQALFEYGSLMGELLDMDVVAFPTYDGGQALNTSIRMSHRITGRKQMIVPETMSKGLLMQVREYNYFMEIDFVAVDEKSGQINLQDLESKISDQTACVVIENPSYLGHIDRQGRVIGKIAHKHEAVFIVYVDPSSLGILEPPINYGADIVCGELQPLGIHMGYGTGMGGIIASKDEDAFIMNFPNHFYHIYENEKGERGFARALNERTSYAKRDDGVEFLGTNVGLWAITAAVYLSLLGPKGMYELGENIIYKSNYARRVLGQVKGLKILYPDSNSFKEFVVNFDDSKKTVTQINKQLLERKIFGGKDLSREFPWLGQSALYCVTEKTSKQDIERLGEALDEIINNK